MSAVGDELANELLHYATRAVVRDARAPRSAYRMSRGRNGPKRPFAPPRSVVVPFAASPVHDENSPFVRSHVAMVLRFIERVRLQDDGTPAQRWLSKRLYIGKTRDKNGRYQSHHAAHGSVAQDENKSVRELQRHLALLRSAKLILAWQPPIRENTPKSMRSNKNTYNVYELQRPVPRVLAERLREFYRWQEKAERAEQRAALELAPPPDATPDDDVMAAMHAATAYVYALPPPTCGPPARSAVPEHAPTELNEDLAAMRAALELVTAKLDRPLR